MAGKRTEDLIHPGRVVQLAEQRPSRPRFFAVRSPENSRLFGRSHRKAKRPIPRQMTNIHESRHLPEQGEKVLLINPLYTIPICIGPSGCNH